MMNYITTTNTNLILVYFVPGVPLMVFAWWIWLEQVTYHQKCELFSGSEHCQMSISTNTSALKEMITFIPAVK